jgi:hypothetical protein
MVVVVKKAFVVDVGFEELYDPQVIVYLTCGHHLVVREALMNKDGVTAWGTRQHACEKCGVEYVAE